MRGHHLHDVAGLGIGLDARHRRFVTFAAHARHKGILGHGVARQIDGGQFGNRTVQTGLDFVEAPLGLTIAIGIVAVTVDNQDNLASQIVEDHHFVGNDQQDIRHLQFIRRRTVPQPGLHVAHRVVAEIAHQPTAKTGQIRGFHGAVTRLEVFDEGQGIVAVKGFEHLAVPFDAHLVAVNPEHGATGQTDHGITAPLLATLHGFEQIRIRTPGQFQVGGHRGLQVGEDLPGNGNPPDVLFCQFSKLLSIHGHALITNAGSREVRFSIRTASG